MQLSLVYDRECCGNLVNIQYFFFYKYVPSFLPLFTTLLLNLSKSLYPEMFSSHFSAWNPHFLENK